MWNRRFLARALPALLPALFATAPAVAEPVTYAIDPDRSVVHFELTHFDTSTIRGRFSAPRGSVVVDRAAATASASVRIATATVSTGLPPFDERIRRPDLLASADNPEAFFVSTQARFEGDRLAELRGEFTLRGVSQPLTLRARRFGCGRGEDDPVAAAAAGSAPAVAAATERCWGDFEGEIARSRFGADFGLPWVGDRVRLLLRVEAQRR